MKEEKRENEMKLIATKLGNQIGKNRTSLLSVIRKLPKDLQVKILRELGYEINSNNTSKKAK